MRLLNCYTFRVEEFFGTNIPPYVILSHTWEDGEVTFQDTLDLGKAKSMKGWEKITATCNLALLENHQYVWVDTCCIDKKNPTELTEAINSMFTWYANAAICYAWLNDYDATLDEHFSRLAGCRWFTRGWTLQELVAPGEVQFYDRQWRMFGTRSSLRQPLLAATGIDEGVLISGAIASRDVRSLLREIPVARRMSWAAQRQTTRLEDMSYSLLGIFDVNMPLLYGEGSRAFIRLQEEILKDTNDLSLLAWLSTGNAEGEVRDNERSVLASSPSYFQHAGSLKLDAELKYIPEFSMTNKGLRISTTLAQTQATDGSVVMWLNCHFDNNSSRTIGIYLKPQGGGVYSRVRSKDFCLIERAQSVSNTAPVQIYIAKHVAPTRSKIAGLAGSSRPRIRFQFDMDKFEYVGTLPENLWDIHNMLFHPAGLGSVVAFHHFRAQTPYQGGFVIAFGYDEGKDKQPWVCLGPADKPLYEAAMSQNMSSVRDLAQKSRKTSIRTRIIPYSTNTFPRTLSVGVKTETRGSGSEKIYIMSVTEKLIFIA